LARRKFNLKIKKEDYYRERQKKWIWVFPKIDKKVTAKHIVDLDVFCKIIFPHSIKKQEVSKAIIEVLVEVKRPMYLKELSRKVLDKVKVSAQTLSDTYKAMLKSGLLEKKYRNEPTQLSKQFSNRLKEIAQYWENYLEAKGVTSS
jgi:DNA-binding HxlR family transcriptional regulator